MCRRCYEEYGSPRLYDEAVREAIGRIEKVFLGDESGGYLHRVIDDWNLDDECVEQCLVDIRKDHDQIDEAAMKEELGCLRILREMTVEQRASALGLAMEMWKPDSGGV